MKNSTALKTLLPAILALSTASAFADAIPVFSPSVVVDGSLADWGVVLTNSVGTSNLQPNASVTVPNVNSSSACTAAALSGKSFVCEDTDNSAGHNFQVTPYFGGQDYDVEFLGMARKANTLFVGLITGQRPDNGKAYYSPGDLFLTIEGVKYAIEMGGGVGGAVAGLQGGGAAGSYYNLNGDGTTASVNSLLGQTTGSIWKLGTGDTSVGLSNSNGTSTAVQFKANATSLAVGNTLAFASTRNDNPPGVAAGSTNTHAIWELSLDLGLFGLAAADGFTASVTWSPSCFNDTLNTTGDRVPNDTTSSSSGGGQLPEPGTLVLVGLGLLGFAGFGRRKTA